MFYIKKGGYLLVEAMFASVIISLAIVYRTHIEMRHNDLDQIRELAAKVVQVPYGIDKRVMLDGGKTLTLSKKNYIGTKETIEDFLEETLIGTTSSACKGGWNPVDPTNSSMNLISCNLFNYGKMPYGMSLDGGYDVNSENIVTNYHIDLYNSTDKSFNKAVNVYSKLIGYSRMLDSPQITGSHRYYLINRKTGAELTPLECESTGVDCAFRAEYYTNLEGVGEDVYLRVNGSNYMRGSIGWAKAGNATLKCSTVDETGVEVVGNCGLNYNQTNQTLDSNVFNSTANNFKLVTNKMTSATTAIPVKCGVRGLVEEKYIPLPHWSVKFVEYKTGTEEIKDCGMTVLNVGTATTPEYVGSGSLMNLDIGKRLNIYSSTGNYIFTAGSYKTAKDRTFVKGAADNIEFIGDTVMIAEKESHSFFHPNKPPHILKINSDGSIFYGGVPKSDETDLFKKQFKDVKMQDARDLVTKGYLHSFNQIINIGVVDTNTDSKLYMCPNGKYADVIGYPVNTSLLMSKHQINSVCPYSIGKGIPEFNITLSLFKPDYTKIKGTVFLERTVGCRWEGDYAQIWGLRKDRIHGFFHPRFILLAPYRQNGSVKQSFNVEVSTNFMTIQFCDQNGLFNE